MSYFFVFLTGIIRTECDKEERELALVEFQDRQPEDLEG